MSITLEIGLLSSRTATLKAGLDEEVGALRLRAQAALGVGKGRLLDSFGELLDASVPVKHASVQDGDSLILHIDRVQVQSNLSTFATIVAGGSVVLPIPGVVAPGGSSVQDQLKTVKQIQASSRDFAE